jgi:hypothetical protein
VRPLALALALAALPPQSTPPGKQEKKQLEQKIEELFGRLASDKNDFIAAKADWMLPRASGRALPPALLIQGDDDLAQELKAKYGLSLVTVTIGAGRWRVRRPAPNEVTGWKAWLAGRK